MGRKMEFFGYLALILSLFHFKVAQNSTTDVANTSSPDVTTATTTTTTIPSTTSTTTSSTTTTTSTTTSVVSTILTPTSTPTLTSTFYSTSTSPTNTSSLASSASISSATTANVASTTNSSNSNYQTNLIIGLVVGIGGAAIIAAIIIGIILCYKLCTKTRRKNFEPFGKANDAFQLEDVIQDVPELPDKPVKVSEFMDHVIRRQTDIMAYKTEFKAVPDNVGKSCSVAKKKSNKDKNRYINILPFNDTLVPISKDGSSTEYINASFISGYKRVNAYIATQAPCEETINDFWRMVWQYDCGRIIMATNLFENGKAKCDKYWPDLHESGIYGDLQVQTIGERTYGNYILRTLKIEMSSSSSGGKSIAKRKSKKLVSDQVEISLGDVVEVRTVYQFHFTTWPDHGVPDSSTAFLKFYRHSVKLDPELPDVRKGPIVVHCSAGVGRTGTLIAVDVSLNRAKAEGTVDIPKCIDKMRRERQFMVQTLDQYIYIHHVLLEAFLLDRVEIPCSQFESAYSQLAEPGQGGQSRLQREFKLLEALKPRFDSSSFTMAENNRPRNRLSSLLAADSFIPYLQNGADQSTIYINAVYVPGYRKRSSDDENNSGDSSSYSYISTQAPIESTINDFWKLIKETGCSTIVMLNNLDPNVERYWPEDGRTVSYGPFNITNIGELSSDDIKVTDLEVSEGATDPRVTERNSPSAGEAGEESPYSNSPIKSTTDSFNVRHIRLLNWPPGDDTLPEESTLLSLYAEVVRCQERNPDKLVLVHCLYGADRSGIFCAMMNMMDTIKLECEVDVFNSVKRVRRTRPEFIHEMVQYKFLYDVAMAHIKSVEKADYVNTAGQT